MKTFLTSIFVLCIACSSQATIYRVGYSGFGVPGLDFAYSDIQSAVNTASAGDTIQIYQLTNTTSNDASIDKPLTLVGFGHSLATNSGLQVQNRPDSSLNYTSFTFNPGSEGSKVQGLNLGNCALHCGDISISRCRFFSHRTTPGFPDCATGNPWIHTSGGQIYFYVGNYSIDMNNISINACYFDNNSGGLSVQNYNLAYKLNNLQITNCYFNGYVDLNTGINGQVNGVFANNIVNTKVQKLINTYFWNGNICTEGAFTNYAGSEIAGLISSFDQFLIKNNIFNTADTITFPIDGPNCVIQNNLFSCAAQYASTYLIGSNNVYKVNMSTVFTSAWSDGLILNDNQLALAPSSPANNAGIKNNNTATNCGIFGGEVDQDYKLSGIPAIPAFYILSAPSVNATTNPYNITISVRSNK